MFTRLSPGTGVDFVGEDNFEDQDIQVGDECNEFADVLSCFISS